MVLDPSGERYTPNVSFASVGGVRGNGLSICVASLTEKCMSRFSMFSNCGSPSSFQTYLIGYIQLFSGTRAPPVARRPPSQVWMDCCIAGVMSKRISLQMCT